MEAVTNKKRTVRAKASTAIAIPAYLIYEELDGKPVYYRGYKEVLAGKKQQKKLWVRVNCRR